MTEPEIGMTVRLHTPERGYRRPFTGAWIETPIDYLSVVLCRVAPMRVMD